MLAVCLFVSSVQSLDQKSCKCKVNARKRIVGGTKVDDRKFPWLASIHSMVLDRKNLTGIFSLTKMLI